VALVEHARGDMIADEAGRARDEKAHQVLIRYDSRRSAGLKLLDGLFYSMIGESNCVLRFTPFQQSAQRETSSEAPCTGCAGRVAASTACPHPMVHERRTLPQLP
jgi:hypothetical protein